MEPLATSGVCFNEAAAIFAAEVMLWRESDKTDYQLQ
jgi:hypothetical protein